MIFDIGNGLWKSEVCDLPDQIHNRTLICQRPFEKESAYFHSINPGFDAEVAEKFLNGVYSTVCSGVLWKQNFEKHLTSKANGRGKWQYKGKKKLLQSM